MAKKILQLIDGDSFSSFAKNAAARRIDRQNAESQDASRGTVRAADNSSLAANIRQQSFDQRMRLVWGKIIFTFPYAHWYRVQLDVGNAELPCCAITETPLQPLGVSSTGPLPPQARVLVGVEEGSPFGYILGVMPRIVTPNTVNFPDWIAQGSSAGVRREGYYKQFPELFTNMGQLIDFSDNRPTDALSIGEWGRLTDLGSGIHIDPFMQFLRIDESAGLWMFYMDRLVRLEAFNWDFRSSIGESQIRNDCGEGIEMKGSTPYPWEAVGMLTSNGTMHRVTADNDVHYNKPYAKIEPTFDDQQAFLRYEEYGGYLGQPYMRHVQVPPLPESSDDRVWRYSQERSGIGVFREQLSLDGSWSVVSAHSLSFAKRVLIPIPKRVKTAEDPTGDKYAAEDGEYKFAGLFGTGPDHTLVDIPEATGVARSQWTPAALMEVMAYRHNWQSVHAFHYHAKDFFTPEQGELAPFTTLQSLLDYSQLATQQFLNAPTPVTIPIDHRHSAKYYETQSSHVILPDGSQVIRDGYGSEIKMSGGNIEISPAADLVLRPGRSVIMYAGDDVNIRARNSIDLYASNHDVRLKAEGNFEVLAGNSGTGRLLLENKAIGVVNNVIGRQGEDIEQNGIIFKSENADVVTLASNIYLRTGGGNVGGGQILLDADSGRNIVRMIGSSVVAYVSQVFDINVGVGSSSSVVYTFGSAVCEMPVSVSMGGPLFVLEGGIQTKGFITAIDGSVGTISPNNIGYGQAIASMAKINEGFTQRIQTLQRDFQTYVTDTWYGSQRIGESATIANTQFAPRNDIQLRTTSYVIIEAYWQQMAGDGTALWAENVINYQGVEMMPHPGLKRWRTENAYLHVTPRLHNNTTGLDADRGEAYESTEAVYFEGKVANQSYLVIGD